MSKYREMIIMIRTMGKGRVVWIEVGGWCPESRVIRDLGVTRIRRVADTCVTTVRTLRPEEKVTDDFSVTKTNFR